MFNAELYSMLHTGNPGDLQYYINAAQNADSVLELGCGSGRITLPIAKKGIPVVGVDISKEMLNLLEKNTLLLPSKTKNLVEIVHGDMQDINLERKFDLVIIPYNALLCLLSEEAVISCFKTAAKHLSKNGKLIFDIYDVPMEYEALDADEFEEVETILNEGRTITVFERPAFHPDPRRLDTTYQYKQTDKRGAVKIVAEYTIFERCIYKEEISTLLAEAELSMISMTGDFIDAPIDDETEQLVIKAQ